MPSNLDFRKVEPQEQQLNEQDDLKAENKQLKEQIATLTNQVAELEASKAVSDSILRSQGWLAKQLFKLGIRFSVGANLHDSIYALVRAWRNEGRLPERELTNVVAAVLMRWSRIGTFTILGAIVAIASVGVLIWQNYLIREQNAQQAQIFNTSRRAELIATIYNRRECEAENIEDCPPLASKRARVEAAIAFIGLERAENPDSQPNLKEIDLSHANLFLVDFEDVMLEDANLQGAVLYRANLQGAFLWRANLQNAILSGADLDGANLMETNLQDAYLGNNLRGVDLMDANLQGASLGGADLTGSYLHIADLRDANLRDANLQDVDLSRANLQGADLRGVNFQGADLSGANLQGSKYDSETAWPNGFNPQSAGAVLEEQSLPLLSPLPTPSSVSVP